MLPTADLRVIADARMADALALLAAGRFDWALYTCGHAAECALKARITTTLNWTAFPHSAKEFERFESFKTHDLNTLLSLTGVAEQILVRHFADWKW